MSGKTLSAIRRWLQRRENLRKPNAYSLDEIRNILSLIPEPAATIFATAAFNGLRRGEIRGMRWEDYSNGEIHVTQSIWEGHTTVPKTRQSRGAVPVIRPLAKILDAHRLRCGNPQTGPIFAAANGKPVSMNNVLSRLIRPALDRCKHCKVSRISHKKADHKYERDASRPMWHGWHAARAGWVATSTLSATLKKPFRRFCVMRT